MKVAVLGCGGSMGSYFTRYFLAQGHDVVGSDAKRRVFPSEMRFRRTNTAAVRGVDAVLVAVPIAETTRVVTEVAGHLRRGTVLIEITSVKTKIIDDLRRTLAQSPASLLSLHPMFGPSARVREPKLCVVGGSREKSVARRFFPDADLIVLDRRSHDRLVAYELSLVHVTCLAFAAAVSKKVGIRRFSAASTPMARAQLSVAKALLSQDASLYSYLLTANPYVPEAITSIEQELAGLRRLAARRKSGELRKLFAELSREFTAEDRVDALRRVYTAFG